MTDSKQFGNPKVFEFGDKTGSSRFGDGGHCAQCEAMLTDALDGTLTAADQELFDAHMAECGPCSQLLADARRGAAFLEVLRKPAPEPPAALLERILAQTSGQASGQAIPGMIPQGFPVPAAAQPGHFGVAAFGPDQALPGKLLPFPSRWSAAFRKTSFGQIMLQPRLAMTAAMAFFSIALTMNITGVHLQDLRASDLKPSSLRRNIANAKASITRSYEGLRVVYELESRVHDLEASQDTDSSQGQQINAARPAAAAPASQPPTTQPQQEQRPGGSQAAPEPGGGSGGNQSGGGRAARRQIVPTPYLSHRDDLRQSRRLLVDDFQPGNPLQAGYARKERTLV